MHLKGFQRISTIHRRGFTALYAVLVSSLALAIGLAVANMVLKESLLSSYAKESQLAFYAANTGLECGLYWDNQGAFDAPSSFGDISCNNSSITVDDGGVGDCLSGCTFDITLGPECVSVFVQKDSLGGTLFRSRGYNTCDANNPRIVERTFTTFR